MDERRKLNQPIIECVMACIKGLKNIKSNHKPYEYLLGQAIRQYAIPIENWHLTIAAQQLWNNLTSEDINKFFYNETFCCDRVNKTCLKLFKGASKRGVDTEVLQSKYLRFNDVFSCEHTTPVKMVCDQLILLENLSEESVMSILENIHITRMLKEEDHAIKEKFRRQGTWKDIVTKVYNSQGIELV
ncbi:MAG: hypothetical protein MJZ64_08160 [Paludibacteraceae bacterium]|nr:hypothetical protein [Paludibacteraceae bacterium]